ncbi:type I-E CRISPR-associated protein Cse1/CasA, partial [Klebsiella pneumoniae]
CERQAQTLINACLNSGEDHTARLQLRKIFARYAGQVFDQLCPADSARQLGAWALARPNFSQYLTLD